MVIPYVECPQCGAQVDGARATCHDCGTSLRGDDGEEGAVLEGQRYDSSIIHRYAAELYVKAVLVTIGWTALGATLGSLPLFLAPTEAPLAAILLVVVLGAIGYAIGSARAFGLRLQAQTSLCQAEIESHARQILSRLNREQDGDHER